MKSRARNFMADLTALGARIAARIREQAPAATSQPKEVVRGPAVEAGPANALPLSTEVTTEQAAGTPAHARGGDARTAGPSPNPPPAPIEIEPAPVHYAPFYRGGIRRGAREKVVVICAICGTGQRETVLPGATLLPGSVSTAARRAAADLTARTGIEHEPVPGALGDREWIS